MGDFGEEGFSVFVLTLLAMVVFIVIKLFIKFHVFEWEKSKQEHSKSIGERSDEDVKKD